ncbi:MAG: ribosome biogenesis GTPase YlqF [Bacillota bacterium]|jgi:ribosome biogenesis GTPase A
MNNEIQWYPGHMARAKKLIKEHLGLVDATIEIVDARIPQSSRNPDVDKILAAKPRIIALNKSDLADKEITRLWINFFQREGLKAVPINGAAKQGIRELAIAVKAAAEPIMQALEAKGRRRRSVRTMIVGIPNVGKSTVINAMGVKAQAKTGNKPGVTRGTQWVRMIEGMELLDTPGLLWPKFADPEIGFKLAVTGAISDEVYAIEDVAKKLLLLINRIDPAALSKRYKITETMGGVDEYLDLIGRKRGFLGPGGIVKLEQTAFMILQEFRQGKIGRFTLERPPN